MPIAPVNGVKIYYEIEGSGTPLLLIMGIGAQLVQWPRGFQDRLLEAGYRIIRFDNRDVGLSTKFRSAGVPNVRRLLIRGLLNRPVEAPYTFTDMAGDAAGLLDHLEIRAAHVLGISLGGMVAQQFALDYPERSLSLISIMSHPGDRTTALGHPRGLAALLQPPPRTRSEAQRSALRFFRICGSVRHGLDEEGIMHRAGLGFDRCVSPDGFARQFAAMIASGSRTERLRKLRVPTLVIHGDADPLIPARGGRATARAIPGSRLIVVEGMGHDLPPTLNDRLVESIQLHTARAERRVAGSVSGSGSPELHART